MIKQNKHSAITTMISIVLVVSCWPGFTWAQRTTQFERRATQRIENEVLPAYNQGETIALLKSLSELTQRLDGEELKVVDRILEENDLPSSGDLMVDARWALVQQNQLKLLPPASMTEKLLMIPILADRCDQIVNKATAHDVMQERLPTPTDIEEYEQLFWEIHVMENQLQTGHVICQYGDQLTPSKMSARQKRRLSEVQTDLLATDFKTRDKRLNRLFEDLKQRKVELRIGRLDLAADVLEKSDSFMDRFQAAFVADLDGEKLVDFFENVDDDQLTRPALKVAELAESISDQTEAARENAGDLVGQSRLFFEGLHWWLRGRFGRGPDARGLLKSVAATRDPKALFGLWMPERFPAPRPEVTDKDKVAYDKSYDQDYLIEPDYDRRHHYVWRFEYRKLNSNTDTNITSNTNTKVTSRTTMSRFY